MAVLIALILIGAVALAVVGYLRAIRRDSRSVDAYHAALGHLQQVAGHVSPGEAGRAYQLSPHVRILPRDGSVAPFRPLVARAAPRLASTWPISAPAPATASMPAPPAERPIPAPAPATASVPAPPAEPSDPARPRPTLVFIDGAASPDLVPEMTPSIGVTSAAPSRRRIDRFRLRRIQLPRIQLPRIQLPRMPRAALLAGSGLAVVALAVTVTITSAPSHHSGGPAHTAAAQTHAAANAPIPVTARPTAPVPAPTLVTNSNANGAVYLVHSGPIALSVDAANRCWIQLRSGSANGPVIFQGVLSPGDQKGFSGLDGLWLRLGYPAGVTIQVDGTSLTVPANSSPFDVTVEEPTPAPAA